MDRDQHDKRWDMHSERQISASKGAAIALTTLNSGSWLALLTQVGLLESGGAALPIIAWGTGAFLGTLLWFSIYVGSVLQWKHDLDRHDSRLLFLLNANIVVGLGIAFASLLCFGAGVRALSIAVS